MAYDIQQLMEIAKNKIKIQKNSRMKYFHCCLIVDKNGKILSVGNNKYTLPKDVIAIEEILRKKKKKSLRWNSIGSIHAEVDAFYKLNLSQKAIKGTTLFVYGTSKAGNTVKSRPCSNCMSLIEHFRVKRVV